MSTLLSLENLEARLAEIEQEREFLIGYIALKKGEAVNIVKPINGNTHSNTHNSSTSGSKTIRGRVIDAVLELIEKQGRQVNNKEVLAYVRERGLSLGSNKNVPNALGAILSQEADKKSARIKRIAKGVYDKK